MTDRYCEATFNYVGPADLVAVSCPVFDARAPGSVGSFDQSGFALVDAPSEVTDWSDTDLLDVVHGPEIERLALAHTGCDLAIVYPAIARNPQAAVRVNDFAPITIAHSDFTDDYPHMITEAGRPYREFLDPLLDRHGLSPDDVRNGSRIAMTQFWRNTGPVRPDEPLAFCDARAIGPERLFRTVVPEYGGERLEFETFLVTEPPEGAPDEWFTFPCLTDEEAIVIRTYDSVCEAEGRPYWTPHSAFHDPYVGSGPASRRQSVEMRALCIWW